MSDFKDRYVLGEGHPWLCTNQWGERFAQLFDETGNIAQPLACSDELTGDDDCPRYRLVLERVRDEHGEERDG
jgi:hypothetical protein